MKDETFDQPIADEHDSANPTEAEFSALALRLFRSQFASVEPYRRLCEARRATPDTVTDWRNVPAVPTVAFKDVELTSLPPDQRTTVFHSSGTTEQRPSRHFHSAESLAVYEASLLPWFLRNVVASVPRCFQPADYEASEPNCSRRREEADGHDAPPGPPPHVGGYDVVCLTPPVGGCPHSSLVHMFATVGRELFPDAITFFGKVDVTGAWQLELDRVIESLLGAERAGQPALLLGTAFSFVHLLDELESRRIAPRLPPGSRVMETGGYKGRSRVLPREDLHRHIGGWLGIAPAGIICEYGMSELSSQAYAHVAPVPAGPGSEAEREDPRVFHFPPWARALVISPETGREVAEGEAGLLRVVDLANVFSVLAVQTEDLAVRRGDGFELIGRMPDAEPRGCSLLAATHDAR